MYVQPTWIVNSSLKSHSSVGVFLNVVYAVYGMEESPSCDIFYCIIILKAIYSLL